MPTTTEDQITVSLKKEAAAWVLHFFLDPKRGAGKNFPTEADLQEAFKNPDLKLPTVLSFLENIAGTNNLEELAVSDEKAKSALEKLEGKEEKKSKEVTSGAGGEVIETAANVPKTTRGTVTALGVMAEIDTVLSNHHNSFNPKLTADLNQKVRTLLPSLGIKSTNEEQFLKIVGEISQETARQTLDDVTRIQNIEQLNDVVADSLTQTLIVHPEIAASLKLTKEEILSKVAQQTQDIVETNRADLEKAAVLGNISQIAKYKKPDQETQELIADQVEEFVRDKAALTKPQEIKSFESAAMEFLPKYTDNLEGQLTAFSKDNLPSFQQLQKAKEFAHNLTVDQSSAETKKQFETATSGIIKFDQVTGHISDILGLRPLSPQKIEELGLGSAEPTPLFIKAKGIEGTAASLAIYGSDSIKVQTFQHFRHDDENDSRDIKSLEKTIERLKRQSPTLRSRKALAAAQEQYKQLKESQKALLQKKGFPKILERITQTFGLNHTSYIARQTDLALSNRFPGMWVPQSIANNPRFKAGRFYGSLSFGIGNFRFSGSPLVMARQGIMAGTSGILQFAGRAFMTLGKIPYIGVIFLPVGGALSGAGKVMGAGGKAKGALGGAGKLAMLAKMGTPMGLAATVGSNIARRLIKTAAAVAGALLLLLGLKALGALAGFVFGAVTGLPLLLIPGAGPFLYAGWVGGWTYFGFTHPMQMINIAAHPLSFASSAWHSISGGFGVPGAAGGFISSVGSFVGGIVTGGINTAIGIAGTAIQGTLGILSGGISSFVGSIGFGATTASAAALPAIAVGTVATTSIFTAVVLPASIFFSIAANDALPVTENQYAQMKKVASPTKITDDELAAGKDVNYTITITAKDQDLLNVSMQNTTRVSPIGKPSFADFDQGKDGSDITHFDIGTLPKGQTKTITYTIFVQDEKYKDSTIFDTAKVNFSVADTTSSITASASVKVGSVPSFCPPASDGNPENGIETSKEELECYIDQKAAGKTEPITGEPLADVMRNVMEGESGGQQCAVSSDSAIGVFQYIASTWKSFQAEPGIDSGSVTGGQTCWGIPGAEPKSSGDPLLFSWEYNFGQNIDGGAWNPLDQIDTTANIMENKINEGACNWDPFILLYWDQGGKDCSRAQAVRNRYAI